MAITYFILLQCVYLRIICPWGWLHYHYTVDICQILVNRILYDHVVQGYIISP